jgi:hypothetical protein
MPDPLRVCLQVCVMHHKHDPQQIVNEIVFTNCHIDIHHYGMQRDIHEGPSTEHNEHPRRTYIKHWRQSGNEPDIFRVECKCIIH